jgi:hypothetical protein
MAAIVKVNPRDELEITLPHDMARSARNIDAVNSALKATVAASLSKQLDEITTAEMVTYVSGQGGEVTVAV